jgi:hypothetical protein
MKLDFAMRDERCKHSHTILVAKDEHEEHHECLDCGEIFDPAERESAADSGARASFGETLSDA